jgi:hypothetical protein
MCVAPYLQARVTRPQTLDGQHAVCACSLPSPGLAWGLIAAVQASADRVVGGHQMGMPLSPMPTSRSPSPRQGQGQAPDSVEMSPVRPAPPPPRTRSSSNCVDSTEDRLSSTFCDLLAARVAALEPDRHDAVCSGRGGRKRRFGEKAPSIQSLASPRLAGMVMAG